MGVEEFTACEWLTLAQVLKLRQSNLAAWVAANDYIAWGTRTAVDATELISGYIDAFTSWVQLLRVLVVDQNSARQLRHYCSLDTIAQYLNWVLYMSVTLNLSAFSMIQDVSSKIMIKL
jgi:hypothetical protein